jgi:ketosteroid isomerase-like protein
VIIDYEHPNHQLVREGFAAIMAGDMEVLRTFMSEDIVVHNTGAHPLAGDYTGHDAVAALLQKMYQMTGDTLTFAPSEVFADDELILIKAVMRAERNGRAIDLLQIDLVHLDSDGKVVEAWVFPEDTEASDAFWS